MINFGSRQELYYDIKSNLVDPDQQLMVYPKPLGVLCSIEYDEASDTVSLFNNDFEFVDNSFARLLYDVGIRGNFIINITTGNTRSTVKWLNYNLSATNMFEWIGRIKIYVFDDNEVEIIPSVLQVQKIYQMRMSIDDIYTASNQLSHDQNFDGLLVKLYTNDGRRKQYHLVPTRYVAGDIVDIIKDDNNYVNIVVVRVKCNGRIHIVRVPTVTIKARAMLDNGTVGVGSRVSIQYTSYITGTRLMNLSCPILVGNKITIQ